MKLEYDGSIDLATGSKAESKRWKTKKWRWSNFCSELATPIRTRETLAQFLKASKDEQSAIKDVGGYVGGYVRGFRRKPENIVHRSVLTLDVDFANSYFWDDYLMLYGNAAILHSTHKHSPESPRLRLIVPLSRSVSSDEYMAISRKVAGTIGIELFDRTTFQPSRLMFWPSAPVDGEYVFKQADAPWLDADAVLSTYTDWTDSSQWPTSEQEKAEVRNGVKAQENPLAKKGVVGLFCRAYSITEALETLLSSEYSPTSSPDRFTYVNGSTAAGLIVYDDLFVYSHHGTDPASCKLCNAFDLVRLHKFGLLDQESLAPEGSSTSPSFKAMTDFARNDPGVKRLMARESLDRLHVDFEHSLEVEASKPKTKKRLIDDKFEIDNLEPDGDEDLSWTEKLEIASKGKYASTAGNVSLILCNDIRLKGKFRLNSFDKLAYVFGSLPWRKAKADSIRPFRNLDYSGLRNYLECVYSIVCPSKIEDSLVLEFERNEFNPVKDYLLGVQWDGQERVCGLLQKYFGSPDTLYSREAMRTTLVGAVARIFEPGCKFDLMLTFVGAQGFGKSTFANKLGGIWFSDTFSTVKGKDAFEQLQGKWIIEVAELAGIRRAEVDAVKQFISKRTDFYRPAFGRAPEDFPRQCIFIGSTNVYDFLNDPTGARRFLPVSCDARMATSNPRTGLDQDEVDQIWAEAFRMYQEGAPLYLSDDAEAEAREIQKEHRVRDDRAGIIEDFLDTPIPENWDQMPVLERQFYEPKGEGKLRDVVCIAEIWCECLGRAKEDMDKVKTRDLNDLMRGLDGWEQSTSTKRFKIYGTQKYYRRKGSEVPEA